MVGDDPGTLEDCAKPFKFEELYMPEDHRHAVDHGVDREGEISQRDQDVVYHPVVFANQLQTEIIDN